MFEKVLSMWSVFVSCEEDTKIAHWLFTRVSVTI